MIISLLGYMGCGKSRVSKSLKSKINFKLIDLDQEIISRNHASINDIFLKKGELYFRKEEKCLLEEFLSQEENIILSLGGGTPAYYNNMEAIKQKTISFYLRAKIPTLTQRLLKDKDKRPLIAKIEDHALGEFIAKHLFERNPYYNQAHYTIDTDDKTPEDICNQIIHLLPPLR